MFAQRFDFKRDPERHLDLYLIVMPPIGITRDHIRSSLLWLKQSSYSIARLGTSTYVAGDGSWSTAEPQEQLP